MPSRQGLGRLGKVCVDLRGLYCANANSHDWVWSLDLATECQLGKGVGAHYSGHRSQMHESLAGIGSAS